MRVDPVKLIQFIVCQVTEFGASLPPIRVVIFLYLVNREGQSREFSFKKGIYKD